MQSGGPADPQPAQRGRQDQASTRGGIPVRVGCLAWSAGPVGWAVRARPPVQLGWPVPSGLSVRAVRLAILLGMVNWFGMVGWLGLATGLNLVNRAGLIDLFGLCGFLRGLGWFWHGVSVPDWAWRGRPIAFDRGESTIGAVEMFTERSTREN